MAHIHEVRDDDPHFKIDVVSRSIIRVAESEPVLIQYDHNSESFSFEVPRYIEGHDTTLCNEVQVHFININHENPNEFNASIYPVEDLAPLEDDEDTLKFSWLIPQDATGIVGPLNFAIRFMCTTDTVGEDGSVSKIIEYSWNTMPYIGVTIPAGMDNSEGVIEKYYDVLDAWYARIEQAGQEASAVVTDSKNASLATVYGEIAKAKAQALVEIDERADTKRAAIYDTVPPSVDGEIVQQKGSSEVNVMSQAATTRELANVAQDAEDRLMQAHSAINQSIADLTDKVAKVVNYEEVEVPSDGVLNLGIGKTYSAKNTQTSSSTWGDIKLGFLGKINYVYRYEDEQENVREMSISQEIEFDDLLNDGMKPSHDDYSKGVRIRVLQASIDPAVNPTSYNGGKAWKIVFTYEINGVPVTHDAYTTVSGYPPQGPGYMPVSESPFEVNPTIGEPTFTLSNVTNVVTSIDDPLGSSFTLKAEYIDDIYCVGGEYPTASEVGRDDYTIVTSDGSRHFFTVKHGRGIHDLTRVEMGAYEDTYKIRYTDGTYSTFKLPNGNNVGVPTKVSGQILHLEDVVPVEHTVDVRIRPLNLALRTNPNTVQDSLDGSIRFFVNEPGVEYYASDYPRGAIRACLGYNSDVQVQTETAYYLMMGNTTYETAIPIPRGTYTISKAPQRGSRIVVGLRSDSESERVIYSSTHLDTATFEVTTDTARFDMILCVDVDSDVGLADQLGYVFEPMLIKGTADDVPDTFIPYPELDFGPQGALVVCGKNMFDPSKLLKAAGWTENDGEYAGMPGTLHSIYSLSYGIPIFGIFEPNTQYTFSFEARSDITDDSPAGIKFQFAYSDGSYSICGVDTDTYTKGVLTSTAGKTVTGLHTSYGHNIKAYLRNIQLEKGPVATAYEKYTGTTYEGGFTSDKYGFYSRDAGRVLVLSPKTTLFAVPPGETRNSMVIETTYNVEQGAAYKKLEAKLAALEASI